MREIEQDIFTMDEKYYLGHCVSADYALGCGIALEFEKRFHLRKELQELGEREYPDCILIGRVFNLVTKVRYFQKPTYKTLYGALTKLRSLVISHSIRYLALPRIGTGCDKLDWDIVKPMIEDIFRNIECEIVICNKPKNKKQIEVRWE